uniref:Guanylate cyclase n=1 Tax=Parastrongyloides trichosuri TaxID=131310 RepID=A0A0N5A3Y9_PARTI
MLETGKLIGIVNNENEDKKIKEKRSVEENKHLDGKKIITISYLAAISVFPKNLYEYIKTVTNISNNNYSLRKKSPINNEIILNYNNVSTCFRSDFEGSLISGALKIAIDEINANPNLLPDYYVKYVFNNTCGDETLSAKYFMDHWKNGVSAFIGPEINCRTEAQMAAAQNLPILAYKCKDEYVSNKLKYPTFARTVPAESAIAKTVVATLKQMRWKKVALVYEDAGSYSKLVNSIKLVMEQQNKHLKTNNKYEILSLNTVPSPFSEFNDNKLEQIIDETKDFSRIYIVIGTPKMGRKLTQALGDKGVLAGGLHLVLLVCPDYDWLNPYHAMNNHFFRDTSKWLSKSWDVNTSDDHKFLNYASHLIAVIPTPVSLNSPQVKTFWKKCNNNLKYFGIFGNPFEKEIKPNRHAYYLYDAVMLYAKSVHEVISAYKKKGLDSDLALKDGKMIMGNIIGKRYTSIQGFEMKINKNGNAIGNYSLMTLQKVKPIYDKNDPNYYPVNWALNVTADFIDVDDGLHTLPKIRYHREILWPRKFPPLDEPECGFLNDKCPANIFFKYMWAFFFFFSFCLLGSYLGFKHYYERKLRKEEIPDTWKIDPKKIEKITKTHDTLKSLLIFDDEIEILSGEFTKFMARYIPKSTLKKSKFLQNGCMRFMKLSGIGIYEGTFVVVKEFTYDRERKVVSDNLKKECNAIKQLRNDNVNNFLGLIVGPYSIYAVREFCGRCSLMDVYRNNDFKLDNLFISSFIDDLVKGMTYLQKTDIKIHGNLKSTNCLITNRFALQISDFGLYELRYGQDFKTEEFMWEGLLWTAPELINFDDVARPRMGTQEGDVYSFGIILHELITGEGPFRLLSRNNICAAEIIRKVVEDDNFRPDTKFLNCPKFIIQCMYDCWQKNPSSRPTFQGGIRMELQPMLEQVMKNSLMDNMMALMDVYQNQLEDLVARRTKELQNEKKKSEALLQRMLPPSVADQLMTGGKVRPEFYESVTIYFSDIVGFTDLSNLSTPIEIVSFLNDLYTMFDSIIKKYEVYKVETIGDAYMVVAGCPKYHNAYKQAEEIASMALHLLARSSTFEIKHKRDEKLSIRIGIHSGCVAAGVVGKTMPRYCLFGDTVNTASRMESTGSGMKIHCSIDTRSLLESRDNFLFEHRGFQNIKGKKPVLTYWLLGRTDYTYENNIFIDSPSDDSDLTALYIEKRNKKSGIKCSDQMESFSLKDKNQNTTKSIYKLRYLMNTIKSDEDYDCINNGYDLKEALMISRSSDELGKFEIKNCKTDNNDVNEKIKLKVKRSKSYPFLFPKKIYPWNVKNHIPSKILSEKTTLSSTLSLDESTYSYTDENAFNDLYNSSDSLKNYALQLVRDKRKNSEYGASTTISSVINDYDRYSESDLFTDNINNNDDDLLKYKMRRKICKDNMINRYAKLSNYRYFDSNKNVDDKFISNREYKALSSNSSCDGYMDKYVVNKSQLNGNHEYDLEAAKSWNNAMVRDDFSPVKRIAKKPKCNKSKEKLLCEDDETTKYNESLISRALSLFNQRKDVRKWEDSYTEICETDYSDF